MAARKPHKKERKIRYTVTLYNQCTEEPREVWKAPFSRILLVLGLVVVVALLGGGLLVMFTPLRELTPGYPNDQTRNAIINNALRADSLERQMRLWEVQLINIQRILAHQEPLTPEELVPSDTATLPASSFTADSRSREDSLLRVSAQAQEREAQRAQGDDLLSIEGLHFFPPIKGVVTDGFNAAVNHYATDIAAPENAVISAVLDGTVTFASWTEEYGYVIQIQHQNNLLSAYKHCAQLFKKVGDSVSAGTAIAVVGSTGTFSTGTHLHFELWHRGTPLNPADYINF